MDTLCSINHLLGPVWVKSSWLLLRLAIYYDNCDHLVSDS